MRAARRPSRRRPRRLPVLVAVTLSALVAPGCGGGGEIAKVGEPEPVTDARADATTTTVADDTGDTGADDTGDAGAEDTGDEGGSGAGGGLAGGGTDAPADETSTDDSWSASPGEFRGQDGLRVAYECPPGGELATVWGTGPFTDDSSVCTAAVFDGLITVDEGGRVVVEIGPGLESYATASANGVTTQEYGTWAGSFDLVG